MIGKIISHYKILEAYDYYLRVREYFASHLETGYGLAIRLYKKALQVDPNYALAYAALGEVYLALYDLYLRREVALVDTAEQHIKKALAIAPDLPEAHAAYGDLYRILGADRTSQAIAEYVTSIRLNPNQPEPLFHLARLNTELGNFKEAEVWCKKCLQIRPTDAEAYVEMGFVSWFQGRIDEASHYYDRAMELKPDHPVITGQKAFFAFRTGRWAEAERLCEQNLRSDPHRRQEIGTLARIAFLHGQTSKALSLYQKLIELGADGLDYFNLGQIHQKSRSLARSDRLLSVERQCQGHRNLEANFVHGHVLT